MPGGVGARVPVQQHDRWARPTGAHTQVHRAADIDPQLLEAVEHRLILTSDGHHRHPQAAVGVRRLASSFLPGCTRVAYFLAADGGDHRPGSARVVTRYADHALTATCATATETASGSEPVATARTTPAVLIAFAGGDQFSRQTTTLTR